MDIDNHDFRPLFKRYMGSGYFRDKAKQLRVTRHTLSRILGGVTSNPEILDECLNELGTKVEQRNKSLQRIKELTETHKQLQGL